MRFEDLVAWQKARELTRQVYEVTKVGQFSKDFGLSSQMQRAAVSVMSNIAEGFDRTGRAEFRHFLLIAKGSCAEIKSQLYVALDIGYIDDHTFQRVSGMADEVGRIIGGLRLSVESRQDKGKCSK
jgi:four helix bundle protein